MSHQPEGSGSDPSAGSRIEQLLDAFLEARRRGERPAISDHLGREPGLAAKMAELFPALVLLGDLSGTSPGAPAPAEGRSPEGGGRRIGRYRLLSEIGRGGMGTVYEAYDEALDRLVALKILTFHAFTDDRCIERFRREARAAARLDHPGIVRVHDVGEEAGIHFYAMQLVEGDSLERLIAEVRRLRSSADQGLLADATPSSAIAIALLGDRFEPSKVLEMRRSLAGPAPAGGPHAAPLPDDIRGGAPAKYFRAAARAACMVAEALAYSHDEGILHRDIKPSNILVDVEGQAWLADFGLARMAENDSLTRSGELVGTLRYMAPERFEGRCDARSDVYSLGLTLYELLTTEPAFAGRDRATILKEVSDASPPQPRVLEPRIPRALERIVLRAVAKDPGERYATARDMAQDLARFLEGRAVLAPAPRVTSRGSLLRRLRWLFAAAFAVVLGSVGVFLWLKNVHEPTAIMQVRQADVDGDGDPDLVTANGKSSSVTLLRNDGHGRFSVAAHHAVGEGPAELRSADLDGDGKSDVAVVSINAGKLELFRGGDRGLSRWKTISFSARPNSPYATDLDRDGDQDLLVTALTKGIFFLENLGGGSFAEPVTLPADFAPYTVVGEDFDGDGDLDVAAQYYAKVGSKQISVLRDLGGGDFEHSSYELPAPTMSIHAIDLDGDGDADLAVSLSRYAEISLLFNDGKGSFSRIVQVPLLMNVQSIAGADLDGDGRLDLAAAGSSYVCVLRGRGDGTFEPPRQLPSGDRPTWVEALDLEGDGDQDLVVSHFASNDLWIYENDGSGELTARPRGLRSWWVGLSRE